jgi:hypothetical protein
VSLLFTFFLVSFVACVFNFGEEDIHFYLFIFGVLRVFYYVVQAGLKLLILLPQPPRCWDYRPVPPHSV